VATISGLDTVLANLDAFHQQFIEKVDEAVQFAGINTEARAKMRCPVDTGRLRSSILYEKTGTASCTIGTNVEYAIYQEMGTRKMPAHPFLWPGAMDTVDKLKGDLNNL
jgi:HK97 gp10 family phage protein